MSGAMPIDIEASRFRVEKARTDGTLLLSDGLPVRGSFFVAGSSATHAGPERIKDVLNAEPGFFPFEVFAADGSRQTVLYNRDHVVAVELKGNREASLDPGYRVATRRAVALTLTNGTRLRGVVSVYRPQGRDRLSDFARSPEQFRYLEAEHITYLVNVRYVMHIVEENNTP